MHSRNGSMVSSTRLLCEAGKALKQQACVIKATAKMIIRHHNIIWTMGSGQCDSLVCLRSVCFC